MPIIFFFQEEAECWRQRKLLRKMSNFEGADNNSSSWDDDRAYWASQKLANSLQNKSDFDGYANTTASVACTIMEPFDDSSSDGSSVQKKSLRLGNEESSGGDEQSEKAKKKKSHHKHKHKHKKKHKIKDKRDAR